MLTSQGARGCQAVAQEEWVWPASRLVELIGNRTGLGWCGNVRFTDVVRDSSKIMSAIFAIGLGKPARKKICLYLDIVQRGGGQT